MDSLRFRTASSIGVFLFLFLAATAPAQNVLTYHNNNAHTGLNSAETTLTLGQINAVRAAFKAGITPARIARQFGISRSNVRKALATDEPKQ